MAQMVHHSHREHVERADLLVRRFDLVSSAGHPEGVRRIG